MRRLLILSFSSIESDPRVNRQIDILRGYFDITVAGFGSTQRPGASVVSLSMSNFSLASKAWIGLQLLAGAYSRYYWSRPSVISAIKNLCNRCFDIVIANDIDSLPLALNLAKGNPVIFDAHEYSPLEFEDNWKWRLFFRQYKTWLCRNYLPMASAACTVSQGIAEAYEQNFGIKFSVVTNATDYHDQHPSEVLHDRILLIHHGAAIRSRRIELMINMMSYLDERFTLDLMLVSSDKKYFEELCEFATRDQRISIVPPVPLKQITTVLNRYDIGVFLLPFSNFNYMHALPNKFFEFIQGRLGIAIGPSPEMARLVKEHDLGIVAEDFSPATLARNLNELTHEQVVQFKLNSHDVARQLSSESSGQVILQMVQRVLDGRGG